MGIKIAPTYDTLTLAYIKENLHESIRQKYNNDIKMNFI